MGTKTPQDDDHRNHEAIVPLTTTRQRFTADVYVAELQAHGIKAHVSSDDGGGWRIGEQLDGYRVMVFESDVPAAREILAEVGDEVPDEPT